MSGSEQEELTKSLEDYIETIYLISRDKSEVRVSDIAAKLKVAKSSVHIALHSLADKNYVTHKKYGAVYLTKQGLSAAGKIYERHIQLKAFFASILGLDAETAESDACAAEHVLSGAAVKAMTELVNKNL